jgi:hypothetical protein
LTEEEKLFIMGLDAEVLQAVNPLNREEKNDFAKKVFISFISLNSLFTFLVKEL